MALSKEENEMLTRVGPGTPAGEMLRRYWQPIGFAGELQDKPKRRRILGEDVVCFATSRESWCAGFALHASRHVAWSSAISKTAGCAAVITAGFTTSKAKFWKRPANLLASTFKERVRQPAYQAQDFGGVIFVYMGPAPAPLLPSYDVLVREDGVRAQRARTVNCNFFQMIENSVDQNHLKWLHRTAKTPTGTTARSIRNYSNTEFSIPTFGSSPVKNGRTVTFLSCRR